MRRLLLLLITLIGTTVSAQLGEVVLGNYCGDDHASPSRQIQKGLQALNKGDYIQDLFESIRSQAAACTDCGLTPDGVRPGGPTRLILCGIQCAVLCVTHSGSCLAVT